MQSVIREMFFGNCGNINGIDFGEKYEKLTEIELAAYKKLTASLTEEQRKILDEYVDAFEETQSEAIYKSYSEGFKTGLRIGIEVND